jgi:GTPase SAR1 family protein
VTLRNRVLAAFDQAAAALGGADYLGPAREAFSQQRTRVLASLRVVLVGRVSSGKSTLANALLGGYRVPTGVAELTYNVNWLRYGDPQRLTVHFRDGRPSEQHDISDLEQLTVRAREDSWLHDYVTQIDFIEVFDPAPYLREFDLVDTPGLDSHFVDDAANTLRFLGRDEGDVRRATLASASKADALVLVFARGLARSEDDLIADFSGLGLGAANPIAAIGALTKVEYYWPAGDPMAEGRRVAGLVMRAAGARRLLFDLRPVASRVAAAAATLTEADCCDLAELARLPPVRLAKFARLGAAFTSRDDLPLAPDRRRALFNRFGGYGIAQACGLLRDGLAEPTGLHAELVASSGLGEFRDLLVDHFGSRADLIKLQRAVAEVDDLHQTMRPLLPPREQLTLDAAAAAITQLKYKEHALAELAMLRDYYDGAVQLSESQAAELVRVAGQHGTSLADRLGLPMDVSADALATQARELHARWAAFTADPSHGTATRRAGYTMRRAAERLLTEAAAASKARALRPGLEDA